MVTLQTTVCSCLNQWSCSQGKIRKCCHNPKRFVQTGKHLGTERAKVETKPGEECVEGVRRRRWRRVQWGCTPRRCLGQQDTHRSRVSLARGEESAKNQGILLSFGLCYLAESCSLFPCRHTQLCAWVLCPCGADRGVSSAAVHQHSTSGHVGFAAAHWWCGGTLRLV